MSKILVEQTATLELQKRGLESIGKRAWYCRRTMVCHGNRTEQWG